MKNKVIKVLVVMIIGLICLSLLNNSYAGDACRVGADFKPNNPQPGDEITIDVSFTYIHDPVCGISFSLEYDSDKFEYIGATATSFWDISLAGTTFFVTSKSSEATTTTGKFATIRLKVKDNAVASTNTIKVTHIEAATDDGFSVNLGDLEEKITIQQKNEPQKENTSGGNTNTSGEKTNTSGGDTNTSGGDNNTPGGNTSNSGGSPTGNTNGRSSSDSIDESRIITINAGSSSDASAKGSDTSTSSKSLPKTGYRSIIILGIALTITGMVASYVLFKKYKNV